MANKSSLKIAQEQRFEGDDWWTWSVWVDGPENELDDVQYVEYTLHPTFREPVRKIMSRDNSFKLSTEGWGVFPIHALAVKRDGSVVRLKHQLKLTYPSGQVNVK
jgi:transcription initiation factor IIF auxiliary subunit